VTLTHDGSQLTTFSPISKDRLIVQIDQLRLQIRNHDNGWQNTAAILYKELLSNSLAQISGISRLFIIPDGKLFEIPFELLGTLTPSGFRAVNADYCVAYLPAASLFVHHRSVSPSALDETAPSFLGFGDPIYSESDQRIAGREATPVDMSGVARCRRELERAGLELRRLKGTRIEIEEIARLFKKTGTAKTLCDEHASVEQLRMLDTSNQLIEFRYLHFATHGVLAGELPGLMEPSLVLTLTNPKDDGFLRMSDIMRLKLKADLVVLSACETGLGEQIAGEGVIGMTRAFLYAGAKSIVVSLWQVPDQPTAQLMIKFYRYMLEEGKDKAEALKMAREDMRREFSDPNCWAPFVYYGTA
jgi:CHAT domain-containing protein